MMLRKGVPTVLMVVLCIPLGVWLLPQLVTNLAQPFVHMFHTITGH